MFRRLMVLIATGLMLVCSSAAFATPGSGGDCALSDAGTPCLDWDWIDLDDGLQQFTVILDANDGQERSVFFELVFEGPFNEIKAFGSIDATDDDPLYTNDASYDTTKDSWFYAQDRFDSGLVGQFMNIAHDEGTGRYEVDAASGGGSTLGRFDLANFVMPEGGEIPYTGSISRGGVKYDVSGVISAPEPNTAALLGLAFMGLAALERRSARRS